MIVATNRFGISGMMKAAAALGTAAFALALPTTLLANVSVTPADIGRLKIAFVYISPIAAAGWTYEHEQARLKLQATLPARVQTTFVESVFEGADAERVFRDLAGQGNKLVFATSFGYQEAVVRVAADTPGVKFEHAGGFKTAANLNTYNVRLYEARWLSGFLAGRTSATGVAGYVAGFPVPEVVQGINAFTLGMRAANPNATVRVQWLNTWFDPPREREAAISLINSGADVLTHHSGSVAVPLIAEEKGVKVISYQSDMRKIAPRSQLAAVTVDWSSYYVRVARSVLDGNWRPDAEWGGLKSGMVRLSALDSSVPDHVRSELAQRTDSLIAGKAGPFFGRIRDQKGTVRLDSGSLSDGEIMVMDWFVEGVVGTLPRK